MTSPILRHGIAAAVILMLAVPLGVSLAETPMQSSVQPAPARPVLSVGGAVGVVAEENFVTFTLAQLKAMEPATLRTSTPWTKGVVSFTGVAFESLFKAVEARGANVTAVALNDYSSTMTVAELVEAGAILAYSMEGRDLSVRDKGPLWIIFPFDADSRYATDAYWSKSVWQIKALSIR